MLNVVVLLALVRNLATTLSVVEFFIESAYQYFHLHWKISALFKIKIIRGRYTNENKFFYEK